MQFARGLGIRDHDRRSRGGLGIRCGRGRCGSTCFRRRSRRVQNPVGSDYRSGSLGLRGAAHSLCIPDGPDDRIVLYERQRIACCGTFQGFDVRFLHRSALYASHCGDHSDYASGGRRCRDGRHFQLAGYALASQPDLLHRVHDFRRIVLRGLRDHASELDGQ